MEYKGYTINITVDPYANNPRTEFDNLGTMVCFHGRYELGDTKTGYTTEEIRKISVSKDYICLPLYLYDHSGITISTNPFSCQWDSMKVGYIFVSKKDIRKEYSCKNIGTKIREKVLNYLRSEVKAYDDFITGNVYGYIVTDEKGNVLDSCWGFYGEDHENNGLLEYARNYIDSIKGVIL